MKNVFNKIDTQSNPTHYQFNVMDCKNERRWYCWLYLVLEEKLAL